MKVQCFFLIAFFVAGNLAATDCVELSQRRAFREAFLVFRGSVAKVELVVADRSEPMVVTFKVDRGWKGPVKDYIRLFAFGSPPSGDGYRFVEGNRYVIYATNDVPLTWDALRKLLGGRTVYGIGIPCRLRLRTDVEKESRILGKGRAPAADDTKR
jgi:hypothetical protein